MKSKKSLHDDLRYIVFSAIYQRYSEPKSRRKAFSILETALTCYYKKGFDGVTFKMISRESGLKPPSLRHYFSDLKEIQEFTIKYIHVSAQKLIVDELLKSDDPMKMLKNYLHAHYLWAVHFEKHLCVWIHFVSFSSRRKHEKSLNTEAVINGAHRISDILARGRKLGVFHHKNDFVTARVIQTIILGWLTTLVTEEIENVKEFSQNIIQECIHIVSPSLPSQI